MSSARARTLTTQSGGECTNHEANVPITACKRNGLLQDIQSPNIIGHSFHGRFRQKEAYYYYNIKGKTWIMIVFLCVHLFTNILLRYTITVICPANLCFTCY